MLTGIAVSLADFCASLSVDSSDLMDEVFELPMEDEANHIGDSSDELELDFVTNHNDAPDKVEDLVLENNVKEESVIESAVTLINSKKNKARLKVEKDHNTKMWQLVLKEVKKPGKSKFFPPRVQTSYFPKCNDLLLSLWCRARACRLHSILLGRRSKGPSWTPLSLNQGKVAVRPFYGCVSYIELYGC